MPSDTENIIYLKDGHTLIILVMIRCYLMSLFNVISKISSKGKNDFSEFPKKKTNSLLPQTQPRNSFIRLNSHITFLCECVGRKSVDKKNYIAYKEDIFLDIFKYVMDCLNKENVYIRATWQSVSTLIVFPQFIQFIQCFIFIFIQATQCSLFMYIYTYITLWVSSLP